MLGSECDLKMYDRNLRYTSPTIVNVKTTFLQRLRNLTATLTAFMFLGNEHDIDSRVSALETTRGLLHRLNMS